MQGGEHSAGAVYPQAGTGVRSGARGRGRPRARAPRPCAGGGGTLDSAPVSPVAAVLASTVVAVGAVFQGTVGFGVGTFAAPLLLLIDPRLVPGPLLFTAGVLITLLTRREWRGIRFRDLAWSVPGRVLGTAAAVAFLGVVPEQRLVLAIGLLVLLAVAISVAGPAVPLTPRTFLGAGALSGFFGTLTAVGGPPIALLYQREKGPVVRGTLSAFFVLGVVISLAGLVTARRFGAPQIRLALVLLPGALAGYAVSGRLARILDHRWLRPAILAASFAAGALVVLERLLP